MALVLLSSGRDFAALADGWRIPKAEVRSLGKADALLTLAAKRAAAADTLAAEAEAAARWRGYEEGKREGRAAGAAEAARAVAALAQETRRTQAEQRRMLGVLALEVVRRIAAGLGPQAVLEALAEQAARELLGDQPLSVHVAPDAAEGVSRRLWPLNAEIEVVADGQVQDGGCLVVTARGSAYASLELELAALERAFAELGGREP